MINILIKLNHNKYHNYILYEPYFKYKIQEDEFLPQFWLGTSTTCMVDQYSDH